MNRCPREPEIVVAAARGWTRREDEALATHAAGCSHCTAVLAAAAAVRNEYVREIAEAHVPSSAIVWWRLERRIREDRARAARRALTFAHGVAGAVGAGVAVAVTEALTPTVRPAFTATWSAVVALAGARPWWLTVPATLTVPAALMIAVVLVLAPTALYVGLGRGEQPNL